MPTFYNFSENGVTYSFDDVFVPAELFREGTLWVWGRNNSSAQLGTNDSTNRSTPVTTFAGGTNWKQVTTFKNSAAIKTDGTLWLWGDGGGGQLGNNATTNVSTPVTTFAGGTNWKQVSVGNFHTAAIKTDGTLWVWGQSNIYGFFNFATLGTNDNTNRPTPVTTFAGGTNWRQVSIGMQNTSAIKTDGTLWVWGTISNNAGINDGTSRGISTPVTTFAGGTNWKQVSCGNDHTAAIKTDGTLWTWGFGSSGKLGNASTSNALTPVTTFAGGTNWKQVRAGFRHTAAIKTDGTLWLWGRGSYGSLGNAVTTDVSTPVTTFAGGTNWKQVSNSGLNNNDYTAAIKTDGTLWVWGCGVNGQLGNASTSNVSTPVTTFAGGTNWKQVFSGGYHTVAVTYDDPVI